MTLPEDFVAHALRVLGDALLAIIVRADLHLKPGELTRSLARRTARQMRELTLLIRRLIFLMALSVDLAPAKPRAPKARAVPAGEDVTASFGAARIGVRLVPAPARAFPDHLRTLSGPPRKATVSAAPLLLRWIALNRVLTKPEQYAARLARVIERWKAARQPRPYVGPVPARHRFGAQLGLTAGAVTDMLRRALSDWPDTG
ncbi:MAG: hypothetical protein R3B98_03855 [Hyphomonas sp.]